MRCLKLHFDVFKISLVHIVTAWQPKCQKLPKYQVLFLLLYVPFFRSSHTTTFRRACPYHGFQEKSPRIIWDPDAAPVCKPQEQCFVQPGSWCSIFQQAKESRCKSVSRRHCSCLWCLLLLTTGRGRSARFMQTSLANLVTSFHATTPQPSHRPSCGLLPRGHNKMGRSEVLSIPTCWVVTVAPHQLPCK